MSLCNTIQEQREVPSTPLASLEHGFPDDMRVQIAATFFSCLTLETNSHYNEHLCENGKFTMSQGSSRES